MLTLLLPALLLVLGDDLGGNARRGSRDFDVSDITDINNLSLDSGRRNNQNNRG